MRVAPEYAYLLVYPAGSDADPRVCALRDWMLEIVQAGQMDIAL